MIANFNEDPLTFYSFWFNWYTKGRAVAFTAELRLYDTQ